MKKITLSLLTISLILIGSCLCALAQEPQPANPTNSTTNATAAFLTAVNQYTNIVVIPYWKYDLQSHRGGYGVSGLYRVTPNFYTGLRYDSINGYNNSAGVQAQLQQTVTLWGWLDFTPFVETSVGIGSSTLYGNAGSGAALGLLNRNFTIKNHILNLHLDLIGDYEHVVQGASDANLSKNSNQINAGLAVALNF